MLICLAECISFDSLLRCHGRTVIRCGVHRENVY